MPLGTFPYQLDTVTENPARTHAIIIASGICGTAQDENTSVWLLSIEPPTIQLLAENVQDAVWSPDGTQLAVVTTQEMIVVTPDQETVYRVQVPDDIGIVHLRFNLQWKSDNDGLLLTRWNTTINRNVLYQYDAAQQALVETPLADLASLWNFELSPDGTTIALSGTCRELPYMACLYDRTSGMIVLIPPHADTVGDITEFFWHPDSQWVIVAEMPTIFGRLLTVSNVDGSIQRDLSFCDRSESCFGWLPANVNPHP